jgi:hypothetical protein
MENKKGAIIVGIVSLLFVGTAIFFVVKGIKAKKKPQDAKKDDGKKDANTSSTTIDETTTTTTETTETKTPSISKTQDTFINFTFPIRRTQSGDNVKKLQELLLTFDSKLLPKKGADSFFGSETETALVKVLGKKSVSSQADIDAIKQKIVQKMAGILSTNMALAPLGITVKYT